MKVLHCPTVVGGNPSGLAAAERSIGLESLCVAYRQTNFGHAPDVQLWRDGFSSYHREYQRWALLLKAFWRFDVIHYNYGSTILRWSVSERECLGRSKIHRYFLKNYTRFCFFFERFLLKNKVIAVTFQGDDARQKEYSLRSYQYTIAKEVDECYYPQGSDAEKQTLIHQFDCFADLIFSLNPDLLSVMPKRTKFIPYAHVNLNDWKCVEHQKSNMPVILHAPSHMGAKGTRFILEAVARLKQDGMLFDFILIENMCYTDARKLYERCDLAIDQLLAGWYGGFAVEIMALGKPVICYLRENDLEKIPVEMRQDLPLIQANPDTIYFVLKEWIVNKRDVLPAQGRLSRQYVEKWHDAKKIAQIMKSDYERCL